MSRRVDGTEDKKSGSKKRGSTDNARRLKAFGAGAGKSEADWKNCDCSGLQGVIVGITQLGGAVTIGLSRDMGAYSLTLLLDGDRETLWFNGNCNLDDELLGVIGTLELMRDER